VSRFLFSTAGSLGDLHPYIAVGRALIARGHAAVIGAAEDYRGAVEAAGVEFAAVGPSLAVFGGYERLVPEIFAARNGPEYLIRKLVMPHLRAAYDDQWQAAARADVLVSHPLAMTLPLVAQRRGLRWVATVLAPMSFLSAHDPPVIPGAEWLRALDVFGPRAYAALFGLVKRTVRRWEEPLAQFRAELGLPPMDRAAIFDGQFSPLLNLALFDAVLGRPQPDWPARTMLCGSPTFDGSMPDDAVVQTFERFLADGAPPLVFALGSSAVWAAGDFWEHAAAAAQSLERRAILVTGPRRPERLPPGVCALPYLPYSRVFPRAAAIVHSAGIGTLAQALRSGQPQLLVPVAFDQPDNARRARALGVGRVLPFRKVNAQALTSELQRLLDQPDHAAAARAVATALADVDGAAIAAGHLIDCARSVARD
jgi:UDP:flavonoid glycosyltransferase YjiC (YdhE family)